MTPATSVGGGRYSLDALIATGGMGEVWRASDTVLGREVAVKILKPEYAEDATFRARFEAEARNTAVLHHPAVAQVFDFGETPGTATERASAYLVMELVPGQPLSAVLSREGALAPDRAADIVAQAAAGIEVAHRRGIVHRDVKPANILVSPEGAVKVTDFGIARAADAVPLTGTGQVIGTPHYLSPEQAQGHSTTPASDVYALGLVLYECLSGRRPFEAESAVAVAMAHLRDPVPPLPDAVPAGLAALCLQALEKDPAERVPSAGVLASQLRDLAASPPVTPVAPLAPVTTVATTTVGAVGDHTALLDHTRVSPTAGPARARRRRGWLLPALAAAAVVALIAGTALALTGNDTPASGPTGDPSGDPSAAASPRRFDVDPADYLGRRYRAARSDLTARGFEVRRAPRPGSDGTTRTVAYVQPHGMVAAGSTVTLGVWRSSPAGADGDDGGNTEDRGDGDSDASPGKGNDDKPGKPAKSGSKHGKPAKAGKPHDDHDHED